MKALEASGGGLRSYRIREIARGRAAHGVKPEFARLAERHSHHAVLEGERGVIDGVVLNVTPRGLPGHAPGAARRPAE